MSLKKFSSMLLLGVLATPALAVLPASGLATTQMRAEPFETRIFASLVAINAQGEETLSPLTSQTVLQSGNVLEYHGHVINHSQDIVRKAYITLNIPDNTELLEKTLSPSRAKGSVDGINYQYMPLRTNINGVMQNVPAHFYKSLQWEIEGVGVGEVATVKYRVKVK